MDRSILSAGRLAQSRCVCLRFPVGRVNAGTLQGVPDGDLPMAVTIDARLSCRPAKPPRMKLRRTVMAEPVPTIRRGSVSLLLAAKGSSRSALRVVSRSATTTISSIDGSRSARCAAAASILLHQKQRAGCEASSERTVNTRRWGSVRPETQLAS
jgi:hypothetical protein